MKNFIDWLLSRNINSERLSDFGKLLLRIGVAFPMSIRHGWPTLANWWKGEISYPDPLGLGQNLTMVMMGSLEAVATLMIVVGILTRPASLMLAVGFSVAVLVVHGADDFGTKELPYLYMVAYWAIFLIGPGRFSMDFWLFGKKADRSIS
jgi:putative oxidoreductase